MRKILSIAVLAVLVICAIGCKKEDIYTRPSWLAGKLFSQIESKPELSTFASCIKRIGYDSVINVSGSYTVFAPNNDAFELYFEEHPEYGSVENIPFQELEKIVKFHIVQNPWSAEQLRQLDVNGWIDTLDADNDEPKGFKRETLLRDANTNYGVAKSKDIVRVGESREVDHTGYHFRRTGTEDKLRIPGNMHRYSIVSLWIFTI